MTAPPEPDSSDDSRNAGPTTSAEPLGAVTPSVAPQRDMSVTEAMEQTPQSGVGLCLSGGGYRAMVFHLGALRRMNEAGWLGKLTRIASVSGGSIMAGVLACGWKQLQFSPAGVATNFADIIEAPVMAFARRTVDVPAVLFGPFRGGAGKIVAAAYDKHLFHGATLQDLPAKGEGPYFIFLATNLSNAKLWRFTRSYMRDWKTPPVDHPTLPLAIAVAASSAFPPVLSPVKLDLPDGRRITLTDGGVFDNLGLEPVLKNCATVFVSDGGGAFAEKDNPPTDWLFGMIRVLLAIMAQVGSLRHSDIAGALNSGRRKGGLWTCSTAPSKYSRWASTLPVSDATAADIAATPTRLAHMSDSTRHRLANFGYAIADATLRTYVDPTLPEPPGFPYPGGTEGK
jgi:NTE family protein